MAAILVFVLYRDRAEPIARFGQGRLFLVATVASMTCVHPEMAQDHCSNQAIIDNQANRHFEDEYSYQGGQQSSDCDQYEWLDSKLVGGVRLVHKKSPLYFYYSEGRDFL
jgi:hypothetical protein